MILVEMWIAKGWSRRINEARIGWEKSCSGAFGLSLFGLGDMAIRVSPPERSPERSAGRFGGDHSRRRVTPTLLAEQFLRQWIDASFAASLSWFWVW